MSARTGDRLADVEQLLRRTYAEVAERTAITHAQGDARIASSAPPEPVRWRSLLAAAAVAVLVVGGLILLSDRGGITPAGRSLPRHVAPGALPRSAADELGRLLPLTELVATEPYDRLVYSADDGSVVIEVFRDRLALPEGRSVEVRDTSGVRVASAIHWLGPDGALVTVSWSGAVPDGVIDEVVGGMVYLDDDQWADVTAHGGFRDADDTVIDVFSVDADEDFEVDLIGSLHEGITLRNGPSGFTLPLERCEAFVDDDVTQLQDRAADETGRVGYLVLVPGGQRSVVVTADGESIEIELTSLHPTADLSVGGIALADRLSSDEPPVVECEEDR